MKNLILAALMVLTTAITFAQPCSNLFFSEYIEGSSFNKAVEIYNPTSSSVDLSNYKLILRGFNGSGNLFPPDTLDLTGTLASGDVFVVANVDADPAILAVADMTDDDNINFNGNDAIALYDGNLGQVIDAVGDYSATTNPANGEWTVGSGSMKDNTLSRMVSVQEGTTNWTTGAGQWDVYPSNTFSGLGFYCNSCLSATDTSANFTSSANTVYDNATTTNLNVALSLCVSTSTFDVDVVLKSGDATLIDNYTTQTLSFASVVSSSLPLTITTAPLTTPATLEFALRNSTNGLSIGTDSIFTLTIAPEPVAVYYSIATVRGNNVDGLPDSLGLVCTVRGTVLGGNLRTSGLNFTMNDGTAGIGVFSPSDDFGYTVSEGDSIEVTGEVSHFNGLAQMSFVSSINVLGTGTVPAPTVVTELDETTESELVRLNGYRTIGQPTGSSTLTYDITNGTDTTEMVIYPTTGISSTLPATFDVIGIGRQFDAGGGSPVRYTRFYQLAPRSQSDIISTVGVEELTADQVSVYPNPTLGQLVIALNNVELNKVTITDLSGRIVFSTELTSSRQTIDISTLSNGMYLLQVAGEDQVYNTSIIKNK